MKQRDCLNYEIKRFYLFYDIQETNHQELETYLHNFHFIVTLTVFSLFIL